MKNVLFGLFSLVSLSATYYSQVGQDKFVNENIFKNKTRGTFVDIGAHKGIEINNTYFFESELDWNGICIEPIPELYDELIVNRSCKCIRGCISDEAGIAQFIQFPGEGSWFSGLKEKFDYDRLTVLDSYGLTKYNVIEVNCFNFNDMMDEHDMTHVDFLSIDTEGGELGILKSIDFSRFLIDVIAVENNYLNDEFSSFLKTKGYKLVTRTCQDEIYAHEVFFSNL